jgi:hypothetical protein
MTTLRHGRLSAPDVGRETGDSMIDPIRRLGDEGGSLPRQEAGLARLQMRQMLLDLAQALGLAAAALAVVAVGARALAAASVLVLGRYVFGGVYWPGALLVGGVLVAAGGGAALLVLRRVRQHVKLQAMIESARTDVAWARQEARDFRRVAM